MGAALKGLPPHTQPEPEGILSLRVDPISGRAATPGTPGAYFELFKAEDTPPSVNELGNGNAPGSPLPADEAALLKKPEPKKKPPQSIQDQFAMARFMTQVMSSGAKH